MRVFEKQLEDLMSETSPIELSKRGLYCFTHDVLLRQVDLGQYGRVDLMSISFYKGVSASRISANVVIYELKKDKIDVCALMQIAGYVKAVSMFVYENWEGVVDVKIAPVLIGSSMDTKSNFVFLASMCDVRIFLYHFDANGIHFKEECPCEYRYPKVNHKTLFRVDRIKRWYKRWYKEKFSGFLNTNLIQQWTQH